MNQPVAKVNHNGLEFVYAIANEHTSWRVKTLFTKEPSTIEWINSMSAGETFVDVGANIGIYSVYAGVLGLKVIAFEPEAENYVLLCRSIRFNDSVDITAYCCSLSNEAKADQLYLSGHLPGGSCHSAGENLDHRLTPREHELKQGTIIMRLDDFKLKADYIKCDVDGFEHLVMEGAQETLKGVKSVLVEINQNLPVHMALVTKMFDLGFTCDPNQVEEATRTEGAFKGCGNWIFYARRS